MGFWIFMLIMDLLIPMIMLFFGLSFWKAAPKDIQSLYGYRTSMSMKNRDTWAFAHRYLGKLWFFSGIVLLPLSAIPLLFVIGKSADVIGMIGAIVSVVDLTAILLSILPTEIALRKAFDKNGNRKNNPN